MRFKYGACLLGRLHVTPLSPMHIGNRYFHLLRQVFPVMVQLRSFP
jgi:hypothetical protein